MFRIVQGDVGSGKTIVALLSIANTIDSKYQCAFMAPTEILASQHYNLAKQLFDKLNIKIELITSKTDLSKKKEFIKGLENGKIDLIIGTQIISKGHNFKNLTLVGVIDADMSLSGGDLRASEKAFQVLHQVSGRAGRENKKGLVVIQTYDPKNQVIEALSKNNRDEFLKIETKHRKEINLPPFGKLAAIIISSKNQRELEAFSINLKKKSPSFQNVMILGPAPAPMYYLRGKYRYRFLIKSTKEVNIQKVIKDWVYKIKIPYTIKLVVDIDPYSFLWNYYFWNITKKCSINVY